MSSLFYLKGAMDLKVFVEIGVQRLAEFEAAVQEEISNGTEKFESNAGDQLEEWWWQEFEAYMTYKITMDQFMNYMEKENGS